MSVQLSTEEFQAIKKDFQALDINNDGHITITELAKSFTENKAFRADFIMRLMDLHSSGSVEFYEFLEMAAFWRYNKRVSKWKVKRMFLALDKDNNGVLSVDEVKQFCDTMYEINGDRPSYEEVQKLVQQLDVNGDGVVDCKEFMDGYAKFEQPFFE